MTPKKQNISELERETEEVAREIYDDNNERFDRPTSTLIYTVKYTVLATLIGAFAGVVGALWLLTGGSEALGLGALGDVVGVTGATFERAEYVTVSLDENMRQLVDKVSPSVVRLYQAPIEDEADEFPAQWPSEYIGAGLVVTNDGWIVTSPSVLGERTVDQIRVVLSDGSEHEVIHHYEDWLEPLLYLRIGASDLLPAPFAELTEASPGQFTALLEPALSRNSSTLSVARITQVAYRDTATLASALASSEEYPSRVLIDTPLTARDDGKPLFDLSGAVIGLVAGEGDLQSVIPVSVITHANKSFFTKGEVVRTWLGVKYLDLSYVEGLPETLTFGSTKGALLFASGENLAVEAGSPADKAGLVQGDIILEVEGEIVNGRFTLTNLIQSYNPGQIVELLILHEGVKQEVEVRLGEVK